MILEIFAFIGFITTVVLSVLFIWYLYTYRPTPNATVKEALFSIRWSYALGIFIFPPTLVGAMDGEPVLGFSFGFGFIVFVLLLQWWMGPV